jgi:hypothetical protein
MVAFITCTLDLSRIKMLVMSTVKVTGILSYCIRWEYFYSQILFHRVLKKSIGFLFVVEWNMVGDVDGIWA